jgi:hypothetical protein
MDDHAQLPERESDAVYVYVIALLRDDARSSPALATAAFIPTSTTNPALHDRVRG